MSPSQDATTNGSFIQKAIDYIKGFGMRLLVHGAALLCAGVVAGASIGSFVFLGTYLGIICLVPRETSMKKQWLMPTSIGLVQMLCGFVLGLPLYQCIFWGGFQTFIQRMLAKKFSLGLEWIVCIFLLPVALDSLMGTPNLMGLLASFVGLSLGGGLFWQILNKFNKNKKSQKSPNEANVQQQATQQTTSQPENTNDIDVFKQYRDSIAKLRIKQILLPKNIQQSLQSLISSAEAIITCMVEDKRDIELGKRFLNRYLPATHSVLDNYRRHCKDASTNPQIAHALSQSETIILRLEQAFAYEYSHLQRNNIDDFSAELRVLDTLLKMENH